MRPSAPGSDGSTAERKDLGLSPDQCRAARALVDWTVQKLARHAGVPVDSVRILERGRANATDDVAELIRHALELGGVEFIAESEKGAGVRFRKPHKKAGEIRSIV